MVRNFRFQFKTTTNQSISQLHSAIGFVLLYRENHCPKEGKAGASGKAEEGKKKKIIIFE